MTIISRLFKKREQKHAELAVIGPPASGKTTFIRYLETEKPVEDTVHTTLGVEVRESPREFGAWRFTTIDTGGQVAIQQTFWELAVQRANAVIFVIDATIRPEVNPSAFQLSKEQLQYALDIMGEDQPLLILLNKQDLTSLNPLSVDEAFTLFGLKERIEQALRTIGVLPTSAKFGDGVEQAITWLIEHLE